MSKLVFHLDKITLPAITEDGRLDVVFYGPRPMRQATGSVGNQLPSAIAGLGVRVDERAFDFLSIAMAVIAADTFVDRGRCAANGWSRKIEIDIPLAQPAVWAPVLPILKRALDFLSGDQWAISVRSGGPRPPSQAAILRKRKAVGIGSADCVSLFSGGLDSLLGVSKLVASGRTPVLVSHSYRGDKSYQRKLAPQLGKQLPWFEANAHPAKTGGGPNDTSMRTRSLGFLAYGAVVASAVASKRGASKGTVDLFVPENGFIALNAPLTRRRVGSHSTRTTHPHFLSLIQDVLDVVGLPVRLANEFRHQTKGEMMDDAARAGRPTAIFSGTVSCGKWKRKNTQCGYCVPCLIRRAAFFRAGIDDQTRYRYDVISAWKDLEIRDDLLAMVLASREGAENLKARAIASGPLPLQIGERDGWFGVQERGLAEVRNYLRSKGIPD
ncbi:Qat anti-phage system QueC-like protein QatC [Pseudorhodobacter aquimaris]|uniref:Qat anti-phage system QueC-like protein QatC n=1 Tax=Pseudorhodobacter aquimaris TaxID=687412 RepID=UPI00067E3166|nr:Qat anti-phage system QueC-like protein QatC [Pseudorhodobacter aquimaris]